MCVCVCVCVFFLNFVSLLFLQWKLVYVFQSFVSIFAKQSDRTRCLDGAHSIAVQNVTSNCNVATLISFISSLYLARRLASGGTFIRW